MAQQEVLFVSLRALDRIAVGVVLLGVGGEVLHLNAFARRIVAVADGIAVSGGRIAMSGAAGQGLRTACVPEEETVFRVLRPSGAPDYVVTVLPAQEVALRPRACARVVLITDPAAHLQPAGLRRIWGLTTAEARVAAALSAGLMPAEIAVRHGVSEATVRTQMRAIFDKTGTRRQGELIRMLAHAGITAALHPFSC